MLKLAIKGWFVDFLLQLLNFVSFYPSFLKSICPIWGFSGLGVWLGLHVAVSFACGLITDASIKLLSIVKAYVCFVVILGWIDGCDVSDAIIGNDEFLGKGPFGYCFESCCMLRLDFSLSVVSTVFGCGSGSILVSLGLVVFSYQIGPETLFAAVLGSTMVGFRDGLLLSVLLKGYLFRRLQWRFQELRRLIAYCDLWVYTPCSRFPCLCVVRCSLPSSALNGFCFSTDVPQVDLHSILHFWSSFRRTHWRFKEIRELVVLSDLWVYTPCYRHLCLCVVICSMSMGSSYGNDFIFAMARSCMVRQAFWVFTVLFTWLEDLLVDYYGSLTDWKGFSSTFLQWHSLWSSLQQHWFIGDFGIGKPSTRHEFPFVWLLFRGSFTWIPYSISSSSLILSNHHYRVTTLSMVRVFSTDGRWFYTIDTAPVTCVEGSTITSSSISPADRFSKSTFDFHSWKRLFRSLRTRDSSFGGLLQGASDLFFSIDYVLSRTVRFHLLPPSATSPVLRKFGASTQELLDEMVACYFLLVPSAPFTGFMKSGASTQERYADAVTSFLPLYSLDIAFSLGIGSDVPCICRLLASESFMFFISLYVFLVLVCRDFVRCINKLTSTVNIRL